MLYHLRQHRPSWPSLKERLAVLAIAFTAASTLLGLGLSPVTAAWTTLAAVTGAVEVSCRLTDPFPAPKTRIAVVVVILVFVIRLLAAGFSPAPTLLAVLGGAVILTEVARRLTGAPYRLPRLSW